MRSRAESGRQGSAARAGLRERLWRWTSRLTVTVGMLCAVGRQGWAMPLAEVLTFSFCAGFVAAGILAAEGLAAASKVIRIGLATGVALTAIGGIVTVFGVGGIFWMLALVAISPAVSYCVQHRWFADLDVPGPVQPHRPLTSPVTSDRPSTVSLSPEDRPEFAVKQTPLPKDLSMLDDAALCLAWRRSFLMLEAAPNGPDRIALVVQRQLYLDELQRRCPSGVAAWLASGARASSNPMPFLGDGSRGEG
jgi:hypothetical protein